MAKKKKAKKGSSSTTTKKPSSGPCKHKEAIRATASYRSPTRWCPGCGAIKTTADGGWQKPGTARAKEASPRQRPRTTRRTETREAEAVMQ